MDKAEDIELPVAGRTGGRLLQPEDEPEEAVFGAGAKEA